MHFKRRPIRARAECAPLPIRAAGIDSVPLRISSDRVVLYGIALFVFGALPALLGYPGDWQRFWAGGATVGTSALFNQGDHIAFQAAHGIGTGTGLIRRPLLGPFSPPRT